MAAPSVPNSFSAGSAALASEANANFSAIVAGLSTGSTWAVVVASLTTSGGITCGTALTVGTTLGVTGATTLTGALSCNGAVTLGNATADDITVTGYVASDVLPKTDETYDLGATTRAWEDIYMGGKLVNEGANLAKTSAPTADAIYPNSMVKAWALITCGAGGAATITEGFNIDSASYAALAKELVVTLHTNMASGNYAVLAGLSFSSGYTNAEVLSSNHAAGSFYLEMTSRSWGNGDVVSVLVIGPQ